MNNYIDYAYYKDTYKGDLIPSNKFDFYCLKATQYIKANTFDSVDENNVIDEVKMCCCELCDIIYKSEQSAKSNGITSEKVGEYSVSYESSKNIKENQKNEMTEVLKLWLVNTGLLYRGLC